ncbi:MAG: DNA mismatch repair protein MutS [Planctomycetia bacterium]|nr:DNA mismatch repair protein MutS [Planctomycetia bacterium]
MALTPMMQQYQDAKAAAGEALLLFRMGDFYELFFEDAKRASALLGLSLTSRDKGENKNGAGGTPMAGFPYHQLDGYLAKLIAAGLRVAVCDQVEDPKQAKGLVKRELTRVVTPGTVTDDALLDPRSSNYLAAVVHCDPKGRDPKAADTIGLAWIDVSTGAFMACTCTPARLGDEIARIAPAECLLSEEAPSLDNPIDRATAITRRPGWTFAAAAAVETLQRHFGTATLEGFGFTEQDTPALRAAGAILTYLHDTQRCQLDHIDRLVPFHVAHALQIDEATRRSLEITRTMREGKREGSLLAVIDRTVTAMGSRLLAEWVANPLSRLDSLTARHDAVAELVEAPSLVEALRELLKDVYDMERLVARATTGRASPRDLSHLGHTLTALPKLKAKLAGRRSDLLSSLETRLDLCPEIRGRLESALMDECPLSSRDGDFIRPGYSAELDELRELARGGKQWIANYQAAEIERSKIPSLKVGFNKVFGYYLEVTHAHRDKVPAEYIRKQTLTGAERYITPELKEYEEKVLSADEKSKELEYRLLVELRDAVTAIAPRLRATAGVLAEIDVLCSLSQLARQRSYCRPTLVEEPVLSIVDGRHPVLDAILPDGTFVPNDVQFDGDERLILLVTGPNMAGKSTYIRQVALITLLAQIGSFVPARQATVGLCDRIFTRVGASDELARGQSTFMVEMVETARILNTATDRSLVILDEIGRGTSTYDGVSLAWSVVEYLHDHIGCRTLFATHYHELTDLETLLSGVKNLNVAVREWEDQVVFLHQIVDGAADKSYGIHVARLAGVPRQVNERAKEILVQLENEHLDANGRPRIARREGRRKRELQMSLFAPTEHPLLEEIRRVDANQMTPLEALKKISEWQQALAVDGQAKPRCVFVPPYF